MIVFINSIVISSKDVRLPVQLQRAMAAEAEAAREARAKVGGGRCKMRTRHPGDCGGGGAEGLASPEGGQ